MGCVSPLVPSPIAPEGGTSMEGSSRSEVRACCANPWTTASREAEKRTRSQTSAPGVGLKARQVHAAQRVEGSGHGQVLAIGVKKPACVHVGALPGSITEHGAKVD